jgi:hypothetical protein
MNLSNTTLGLLVLLSLGLSVVAIVLLVMRADTRRLKVPGADAQMDEVVQAILDGHGRSIARLEAIVRKLAAEDRRQGEAMRDSVQHVGMVRYDAFEDVGGRLSFSCALLDDRGDGVVITSINGRQDTRVYAKPITGGKSVHNLSEEEVDSIRQALSGPQEAVAG